MPLWTCPTTAPIAAPPDTDRGQRRRDTDGREDCCGETGREAEAEPLQGSVPSAGFVRLVNFDFALQVLAHHGRIEFVRGAELVVELSKSFQIVFRVANVGVGRHEDIEQPGIICQPSDALL